MPLKFRTSLSYLARNSSLLVLRMVWSSKDVKLKIQRRCTIPTHQHGYYPVYKKMISVVKAWKHEKDWRKALASTLAGNCPKSNEVQKEERGGMLMTIQLHKLFIMLSKNFHTIGDALVISLLDRTMATNVSWCQFSVTGVANNHFPAANMQKQIHKSKNKQNDRTAKLFLGSAFGLFSENTLL